MADFWKNLRFAKETQIKIKNSITIFYHRVFKKIIVHLAAASLARFQDVLVTSNEVTLAKSSLVICPATRYSVGGVLLHVAEEEPVTMSAFRHYLVAKVKNAVLVGQHNPGFFRVT